MSIKMGNLKKKKAHRRYRTKATKEAEIKDAVERLGFSEETARFWVTILKEFMTEKERDQ